MDIRRTAFITLLAAAVGCIAVTAAHLSTMRPQHTASLSLGCDRDVLAQVQNRLSQDLARNQWGDPQWTLAVAADLDQFAVRIGGPAAPDPYGTGAQDAGNLAFALRQLVRDEEAHRSVDKDTVAVEFYAARLEADVPQIDAKCTPGVSA